MPNYIAYQSPDSGLWSVANSERILCYLVERSEAAALLTAEGESPELVAAPAEQFYPTMLSALEFTTDNISHAVERYAAKYAADDLRERIDGIGLLLARIANDVDVIARDIERQNTERETAELEAEELAAEQARRAPFVEEWRTLSDEVAQLKVFLDGESQRLGVKVNDLASTRQYRRLQEAKERLQFVRSQLV